MAIFQLISVLMLYALMQGFVQRRIIYWLLVSIRMVRKSTCLSVIPRRGADFALTVPLFTS